MKVKIHKESKNLIPEKVYDQIPDAVNSFIDYYDLNNCSAPLYIIFKKDNDTTLGLTKTSYIQFGNIYFKPKMYTIYINPEQTSTEIIKTLFHELAHVKQYHNKELKISAVKKCSVWKGELYSTERINEIEYYKNLPWEVEARMISENMMQVWKNGIKKDKPSIFSYIMKFFKRNKK